MTKQEQMMSLLERAYTEGYNEAMETVPVEPPQEDDDIQVHDIEGLATKKFFDVVPASGYAKNEYSAIWPVLMSTDVDDARAEMNYPYCVYGKGDKVVVSCDDEPSQTITPYKECFAIFNLTPNKTYTWKQYQGTKVLSSGTFKTIGRMKWLKTPNNKYPHNLRDLGCTKELMDDGNGIAFGRIVRGEEPNKIEVDSADHIYLRDQLGVTVQLNLRDAEKDPPRTDLFEKTYSYNIPAYSAAITGSSANKKLIKYAFDALVTELAAGRNVLVNCWQGRDRTGTFCWLIQSLCGMSLGYTEAHWELSSFDRCENSKIWNWEEQSGGELKTFIYRLVDLVRAQNNNAVITAYTLAYYFATKIIGITDEKINQLISILKQ